MKNTVNAAEKTGCLLNLTGKYTAEIIKESLKSLGYERVEAKDLTDQVTAKLDDEEREDRLIWRYRFNVKVNFKKLSSAQCSVDIFVSEDSQHATQWDCDARVEEIWEEIASQAEMAMEVLKERPKSTRFGSAAWATETGLRKLDFLESLDDDTDSARFICGEWKDEDEDGDGQKKLLTIPELDTHAHVLVCGPTGCGKSSGIFIPNLLRRLETSALVTEAVAGKRKPPTLYTRTAGWRAAAGHKVFYFNPSDLSSTRINPLDAIRPENDRLHENDPDRLNFYDSAVYVSSLIMANTKEASPGEDKIWSQSEQHLLTSLLLYAVSLRKDINGPAKEGDKANLGYIRALLREGPEGVEEVIKDCPIRLVHQEFRAYLRNTSPNFRYGVASGLMARLNSWVNPQIAALTEVTDFDPDQLKGELFTFYIASLITRPAHRPVAVLAFNYLVEMLLDTEFKYPVTLLLDEFTNFGCIPEVENKLAMVRNQGMGMVLGIQHVAQVRKLYKQDHDAILAHPGTRIFFRPRDLGTARMISDQLGYTTDEERDISGLNTRKVERARKLLDESEVQRMPKGKVVILMPDGDPVRLDTFAPTRHNDFTKEAPPARDLHHISEALYHACYEAEQDPDWRAQADRERKHYLKERGDGKTGKSKTRDTKGKEGTSKSSTRTKGNRRPKEAAEPEEQKKPQSRFKNMQGKRKSRFQKES